jgi:putative flavoprotein involved in K+ transport
VKRTDAIIIGGGQAGLAMSRCLTDRGIDHVVLERGQIAERWRSERWDSLRLLTPNWQSRLPGFRYRGPDPDGFMTMPEVVAHFAEYASSFSAPVESQTTVLEVEKADSGYQVTTDRGVWVAKNVVVATGHCDVPFVPGMGLDLSHRVLQVVPTRYRNPNQLPEGGVLVVGASASGLQIADELRRCGRDVVLSVGQHTRLPRRYRGMDIMWWLDALGISDAGVHEVHDIQASRRQPSLQLVGGKETLDLSVLQKRGVELVGRTVDIDGSKVRFADDLVQTTAAANVKLNRLLGRIDAFLQSNDGERPTPIETKGGALQMDLKARGIHTVLWATGFRRSYRWLRVPVLDARGEIRHEGGITSARGLYVLGLNFLRRRNSSFIDGVGTDAGEISAHIESRLKGGPSHVAA